MPAGGGGGGGGAPGGGGGGGGGGPPVLCGGGGGAGGAEGGGGAFGGADGAAGGAAGAGAEEAAAVELRSRRGADAVTESLKWQTHHKKTNTRTGISVWLQDRTCKDAKTFHGKNVTLNCFDNRPRSCSRSRSHLRALKNKR
jgi:hypothetical protein